MYNSVLTYDDIGTLTHVRTLTVGMTQSMLFLKINPPPIFDPTAPKYDQVVPGK